MEIYVMILTALVAALSGITFFTLHEMERIRKETEVKKNDLSDAEIVRLYGNRWSIECCFKVCKSLLKLGNEFHGVSYDLTVSSTALVFTRYILLEWIRRQENDGRTLGELVYCVFDEVRDMELADSLRMLFDILLTGIRSGTVRIDEAVRVQLLNWFCSQPRFIQTLFRPFFSRLDSANCVPA